MRHALTSLLRTRRWIVLTALGILLAGIAGASLLGEDEQYELDVVLPVADGVFEGGEVMMRGRRVGTVESVGLDGDHAIVSIAIDEADAPLPAGTTARISWSSVVGRRTLDLLPGPTGAPDLPSGKLIESQIERVELDDLLATLDEPTRRHLGGVLQGLQRTIEGREGDVASTLRTAGPTMQALGEVLRAVGEDGPVLRDLVTRLRSVSSSLSVRDDDLRAMLRDLDQVTATIADRRGSLATALAQLPATIDEAVSTLDEVPGAVDVAAPLLDQLRPSTEQLPAVARQLSPTVRDLRPTLSELRPTVESLDELLQGTPGLLTTSGQTLPDVTSAVDAANPAVAFLRPYTPELTGWLTNWTSLFMSQTSGNYARALITASGSSLDLNPGFVPPGMVQDNRPAPGSIAGQAWTDANGDTLR